MGKNSSEKYLDRLLNSTVSGEKLEDDILGDSFEGSSGAKDEEDFLEEFERELNSESYMADMDTLFSEFEDLDDPLSLEDEKAMQSLDALLEEVANFEMELPKVEEVDPNEIENEEPVVEEPTVEEPAVEEPVLEETTIEEAVMEETVSEEPNDTGISLDEINLDNLMEGPELAVTEDGEGDLTGLSEADLLDMLTNDEALSEIGELLSEGGDESEAQASIDAFAANEMSGQDGESLEGEEAGKKKNFFQKLLAMLFKTVDEDEKVDVSASDGASAEELSDENAKIIQELEGSAAPAADAKPEKKKKEKKKKEKKEKPKKEKKPKEKKPKKEKPPKEKDNTPKLPRGPVMVIWAFVGSLFLLVMIGTNLAGYSQGVSNAKGHYDKGMYVEAYKDIAGVEVKEKDLGFYNKVETLAKVDYKIDSYKVFKKNGYEAEALDALVCAAGRYVINRGDAEVYECMTEYDQLGDEIQTILLENYNMSIADASNMYNTRLRDDYSVKIHNKVKELGLE